MLRVLHVTHKRYPLIIGSNVTVGHSAVVHAATVNDFSLIGMGAVILDNACVGPYSLVAAGAVVVSNSIIPEGVLAAGVPAKVGTAFDRGRTAVSYSICPKLC